MLYSQVLATVRSHDGGWTAEVPESWAQGRTIFGGLQAALAVRAMRDLVPQTVPLRVLQASFIAPIAPGPVRIEASVLRRGKSVAQVEARILDQQQTACLVFAVFGEARPSVLDIRPPRHGLPPAEAATPFVYVEGVAPAFTQHVAMRWLGGVNIFRGAKEPRTGIYVGFRDDPYAGPGALGETQIIGYADIVPTPGLSLLKQPTMASSLSRSVRALNASSTVSTGNMPIVNRSRACDSVWRPISRRTRAYMRQATSAAAPMVRNIDGWTAAAMLYPEFRFSILESLYRGA